MEGEGEIEFLLGELPCITSAPLHFDDRQGSPLPLSKSLLSVSHADSLASPDSQPNLPSTLFDSCFVHPSGLSSPGTLHRPQQSRRQYPGEQRHQHLQAFQSPRELKNKGNQISQQLSHHEEESIRSTVANLSLQGDPDGLQFLPENGNGSTNYGKMVAAPEGYLGESAMRNTCGKPSHVNEPFGNGYSFSVSEEPTYIPATQKLQILRRPQGLDGSSTGQATGADRPSMKYFQVQQSPFEDRLSPEHSEAAMLTMPRQSACRSFHGSDSHGSGIQVNVVPQELQYDGQVLAYIQQQKLELARQVAADRQQQQAQQRLLWEQQSALYASLHNQVGGPYRNYYPAIAVPGIPQQSSDHQQHQTRAMAAVLQTGWNQLDTSNRMGLTEHADYCRYCTQGQCIRGDSCPFLYLHSYGESDVASSSLNGTLAGGIGGQDEMLGKIFPSRSRRSLQTNGNQEAVAVRGGRRRKGVDLVANSEVQEKTGVQRLLVLDVDGSQQLMKFTTLEEVEGRIYNVAKDQHGGRFLQRKFDEGNPEDVKKIFEEIRDHLVELMTDPFGNYLVQKLLEVCNEAHRMDILEAVTKNDDLINISLNMHGTRAVQKLIETLRTPEQVAMVILSLKQGVVTLIKDINGNHVVQRCLQRLGNEDSQFIFDAAASHCVEIASHRHGCCVLQRCVDFASGVQRQCLVAEIATNALVLSQDPFGNYVVQYILELRLPWASAEVTSRLEGSYPHLAMQKFSSNVVEKCLKLATEENKACIVKELVASSVLGQLLQDPYANYVIQSALQVTKGPLHMNLVEAIHPHVPMLRSSPYGKRILSRIHSKK